MELCGAQVILRAKEDELPALSDWIQETVLTYTYENHKKDTELKSRKN